MLLKEYSLLEVCGIQWDRCVTSATNALKDVPESRKIEVRYESLAENPSYEIKRIMNFLNLEVSEESLIHISSQIQSSNVNKWETAISQKELEELMSHIYPTIQKLGYLHSDFNIEKSVDSENVAIRT